MDPETIDYYNRHAAEVGARYRSVVDAGVEERFREAFPDKGSRVLDFGSGSGRDVHLLLGMGYDAFGSEPSEAMRADCEKTYPELHGRIFPFSVPLEENADTGGQFDGVLCSAVLMHVPETELFGSAFSLRRVLRAKGRLLLSVPAARPGLDGEGRDEGRRLFTTLFPERLTLLFERLGFQLLRHWEQGDRLGRADIRWNVFLFELDGVQGRPLDRIERVMNRDDKTATYKLALCRALSEIGTSGYHQVQWVSNGEVAVPIRVIAEKWFRYYWPIFEAPQFVPQKEGERTGCSKPVAFRALEGEVIEAYRNGGGLSQFLADERAGGLAPAVEKNYAKAVGSIEKTIKAGPVVHASGEMFRYDAARRAVMVSVGAWREFCQLGHWIEPAVVLRWAEETERMSAESVRVAEALNLLVVDPAEGRDVGVARGVFDALEDKVCVWSDRRLGVAYAVDHVIPFTLWHCNDLWNLLPCDGRVNTNKSDKLPERDLLLRRRDCIVYYWELLREQHERRFGRELARFGGVGGPVGDWRRAAFDGLVEAVELTAVQRGAERWRPQGL